MRAKSIVIAILILSLTVSTFSGCNARQKNGSPTFESSLKAFSEALSDENLDGMTLTIYYETYFVCTTYSWETPEVFIERIEKEDPDGIITINTNSLENNRELLKGLNEENFVPSEEEVVMDIFRCFVFKTSNQEKLLEIAIGGWAKDSLGESSPQYIYVNGFAVRKNDAALEILDTLFQQVYSERDG